ncbi:MAG: DUF1028 domain-containing protein [Solirubrobacterales bacterium]
MTFSLLGRCAATGQLGAATTTSDLAVGARVPFAAAGLGVAVTQHRTDPRLGPRALALLASGCTPQEAVDAVAASTPHRWWRQVALMDAAGTTAAYSGAGVTPVCAAHAGAGCLAVGNMLVSDEIAPAMAGAFAAAADAPLAHRLIAALEAGEAAGGETGTLRSAAVLVVERETFPLVDLRVDSDPAPLDALRRLWEEYGPWAGDFVRRALDPDRATGRPDADHRPRSTTTQRSSTVTS